MKWDNEDYTDKEERLEERLWQVEREGRPRCWISRTVVTTVQPLEEQGVVKRPVEKVKVRILEDEHHNKADP
jgi:hypothetical protein